jgi:hypothetical protein
MFKRTLSLAVIFGTAATAPPAASDDLNCGDRAILAERLATFYGEQQSGLGLESEQRMVEVWSSEETGTWTILMTLPSGRSCVMASGGNWMKQDTPTKVELGIPG